MIEYQNTGVSRAGSVSAESAHGAEQATGTFKMRKVFESLDPKIQVNCLKEAVSHFKSLLDRTAYVLSKNVPEYVNIAMCHALLSLHLYENTYEKNELEADILKSKRKIGETQFQDRFEQRTEDCARAFREGNVREVGHQIGGACVDGTRFVKSWIAG